MADPTPITDEALAELERLEAAASPAPWRACGADRGGCPCGLVWTRPADTVAAAANRTGAIDCRGAWEGRDDLPPTPYQADAALIAALRNAFPAMVARIRAATKHAGEMGSAVLAEREACALAAKEAANSWAGIQTADAVAKAIRGRGKL